MGHKKSATLIFTITPTNKDHFNNSSLKDEAVIKCATITEISCCITLQNFSFLLYNFSFILARSAHLTVSPEFHCKIIKQQVFLFHKFV